MYSFYQSHSTILYNYNIYRCSSVCLFTSNDGGELRGNTESMHLTQVQNTSHQPILSLLIDLSYRDGFVFISQRASWHVHDSSSSHRPTAAPNTVKQKHQKVTCIVAIHLNIDSASLVALSVKIYCTQLPLNWKKQTLKHRQVFTLCGDEVDWDSYGSWVFIHMWNTSSLYSNFLSDSFVFHNTHPIIEKIKYANLRM